MKAPLMFAASIACVSATAHAQQPPGCPPGSWYCAESTDKPAAPAGKPVTPVSPLVPATTPTSDLPTLPADPPPQTEPPPQSAPPPPYLRGPSQPLPPPGERPAEYTYQKRPAAWYRRHELGFNFNGQLAFLKTNEGVPTAMLGLGAAFRYRPIPWLGFEAGLNVAAGRDYYAQRRSEVAGTLTTLVFFNPQHRVQFYGVGGLLWAAAALHDEYDGSAYRRYGYFGGLLGLGLEARISPHLAVNGDYRVFLRTRTDSDAAYFPEFYNPTTGRTSNTSAAGFFNIGMTVYF